MLKIAGSIAFALSLIALWLLLSYAGAKSVGVLLLLLLALLLALPLLGAVAELLRPELAVLHRSLTGDVLDYRAPMSNRMLNDPHWNGSTRNDPVPAKAIRRTGSPPPRNDRA